MKDVQALLVDFDGTLVDTAAANHAAYAAALAEVGITIDRETFDVIAFGRNWRQFLPDLLAGYGVQGGPAAIAHRKTELYPRSFNRVIVNQALVGLLALCRGHARLALVTTASGPNVAAILKHFGLEDLFELLVVGEDVARHKPEPDAYHLAAERLGVKPDRCVVVEDSDIGIAAGLAFGARVLRTSF